MTPRTHALSVDVEDWSNVVLLHRTGRIVPPQPAVVENTKRMLSLFQEHGARATWFVLGEVAERYPELVRELAAADQEIGVHGYQHHFVYALTQAQFRDHVRRAKEVIEQIAGRSVRGYRAAAFSIRKEQAWAFEVLAELGFEYDSSVFPFRGSRYGMPDAPMTPYEIETRHGRLTEIPLSVMEAGPLRLPCCGGGYLRHLPRAYTNLALKLLARHDRSAVFYLHPYELQTSRDSEFFDQHSSAEEQAKFRFADFMQYRNRSRTAPKLRWLLKRYRFDTIEAVFQPAARTQHHA